MFYLQSNLFAFRLRELEEFSERVSDAHNLYNGQPTSTHLYHPVNAFQLVNRYSNGWMKLHDNVYRDNSRGIGMIMHLIIV